jgi:hypothetical protein
MLGAHLEFSRVFIIHEGTQNEVYTKLLNYVDWLKESFKKCVVKVNKKEFDKIASIPYTYLGHENTTLGGIKSCAIAVPVPNDLLPNVLKFAKLWKPNG